MSRLNCAGNAVLNATVAPGLGFGLSFTDLYCREGLLRVDGTYLRFLYGRDGEVHERLLAARAAPSALGVKEESGLLLEIAPHLDAFIAKLFGIEAELD